MLRLKAFGGCKSQIFAIGAKNARLGNCITEARRRSVRHGDDFDWLEGPFAIREARGAHGCSASTSSQHLILSKLIKLTFIE